MVLKAQTKLLDSIRNDKNSLAADKSISKLEISVNKGDDN